MEHLIAYHAAALALLRPDLAAPGQLVAAAEFVLDIPQADPIVRGLAIELLDERACYEQAA